MTPLLRITGLKKYVGARRLFDIDLLDIAPATAYVLTGINGVGKSTLLRILAGLEPAQIGSAMFASRALAWSPYPRWLREQIVYVHQHPVMFAGSVEANIGYGLAARGMEAATRNQRVTEAMNWAGVTQLTGTRSSHWSGGEKQRVALARARVLGPKLLLLDEPTANLDGPAREQVIALIPTLLAEGGSIIMACHDRDLIGLPGMQRLKLKDGHLTLREPVTHNE